MREMRKLINYRFARSQTVLHVTLEDYAVRFGKPKGLIYRLQSVTVRGEAGEDGRIDGTSENLYIKNLVNFLSLIELNIKDGQKHQKTLKTE